MKVLFITEYINAPGQGAYMVANAHYKTFCEIFNEDNIDVISIKTSDNPKKMDDNFLHLSGYNKRIDRLKNLLAGYPAFMSKSVDKKILKMIKEKTYDLIYFDNCYFGTTIKNIKKYNSNLNIWTFYHGVKANSSRQLIKKNLFKPQFLLAAINNIKQEKLATKYSDKCILLNERENKELYKYYGRHADCILPVYYNDTAKISKIEDDKEFKILFLGGYFWPNIIGITWFAENVMPYINSKAKLYIVGRGMDKLNNECFMKDNISVIGETDNLDYWYNSSNIAVGPIFDGDGMKTKTVEALMYGKKYLGTDEALCGYIGLDELRCNTKEEFIEKINSFIDTKIGKYDENMRKLYEKYYSPMAAKKIIQSILNMED